MENDYERCHKILISGTEAFNSGNFDLAYDTLEPLVHYVTSYKAREVLSDSQLQNLRNDLKKALARFTFCPDEAFWEESTQLYDLLR